MRHFESTAAHEIPRLLDDWLGGPVEVRHGAGPDFMIKSSTGTIVVELNASDDIAGIEQARQQLRAYSNALGASVEVLAVPYMGRKARDYAAAKALSWLDLSGNADIRGPGLRILIQGKTNRFASPGRPSTVFSPRASRLSRAMLIDADRWWLQKELAKVTELSAGYVSKVVRRMLDDDLLERRDEDGRVCPRAPSVLLDAWAQEYEFAKHDIARFHAVGRTGLAVLKALAERLGEHGSLRWAATGLAAAWMWTQFADFRLTTVFLSEPLHDPESVGLRPVERGENVWIVLARDDGVFHGTQSLSSIECVHPVQTYLDLLGHPERGKEAASSLRTDLLAWRV
ncbi:MAG: hypothetical protein JRI25_26230 [Deltaproteobacteria bacterium]|nr:hypothetical protein [Deltaproteobacteria bacterium]